jgi:hypothetical protein
MMIVPAMTKGAALSRNNPHVASTTTANDSADRAGLECVIITPPATSASPEKA